MRIAIEFVLVVVSFVAGSIYGRNAEAKAMACVINLEANFSKDINNAIPWLQKRFPRMAKHLL